MLTLTVLALAACGGDDENPSDGDGSGGRWPAASLVATDATATDAGLRPIDPSAISPDGGLLFLARPGELCIVDLLDPEEQCVPFEGTVWGPVWSDDSSKVAFTDDFFLSYDEPDVRVLDVAESTVSNLTDDGVDTVLQRDEGDQGEIDMSPTWVGDDLVFLRSSGDLGVAPRLMRMRADGGDLAEIGVPRASDELRLTQRLVLSPDGDSLFTTAISFSDDPPELVRIDLASGEADTVGAFDLGEAPTGAEIVDLSSDGSLMLVSRPDLIGSDRYEDSLFLVDLEDGSSEPVLSTNGASGAAVPVSAAFSPDGTSIALVVRQDEAGSSIWAVDVADIDGSLTIEDATELLAADDVAGAELDDGSGFLGFDRAQLITWTDAGRLVVSSAFGSVVSAQVDAGS